MTDLNAPNAPYTVEDLESYARSTAGSTVPEISIQTGGNVLEIEEGWTAVFSEGNVVDCHLDLDRLDPTDRETVREAFDRIRVAMEEIGEVLAPWQGTVNAAG